MALRGGDTFQAADRKREEHLWIILSDPENYPEAPVLIANLTTQRADSDSACMLARGDHPFIKHDSCVNYQDSRLAEAQTLAGALAAKLLVAREPVSADVLQRIRIGATVSRFIPLRNLQLLKDQALVE
ncbi:MAG TPA: hypothetical protein VNE39_07810 [Planctomycetota bacterium]|nr:hypothetical protein [Planctomycetota bacterium]